MKVKLKVWRQKSSSTKGEFVEYTQDDVNPDMSFLEMLDVLNNKLIASGDDPVAFDHDCREGICGSCSMVINGRPHGPRDLTTACQLHMREFNDDVTIVIEPWRAKAFPVLKDLVVDRGAFDRIIQAGGFVSVNSGSVTDANIVPIPKDVADTAFDAAACIGCGACVAACPNASASLFTAAKVSHLGLLPQGQPERFKRVKKMIEQMDKELFGSCTNHGECQDACPKGISISFISRMNKDYIKANLCELPPDSDKLKAQ